MTKTAPLPRLRWIVLLSACATFAGAQGVPSTFKLARVKLDFVPVREALDWLFKQARTVEPMAKYSIDEGVLGTVSLARKDVGFKAVLDEIARQTHARYSVQNGAYAFVPNDPFKSRSPMTELKVARSEIAASYGELARRILAQPAGGPFKPLSPDFRTVPLPKGQTLQDARRELLKLTKEFRNPLVVSAAFQKVTDDGMSIVVTAAYARPKLPPLMFRDVWSFDADHGWTLVERRPYLEP